MFTTSQKLPQILFKQYDQKVSWLYIAVLRFCIFSRVSEKVRGWVRRK